MIIVQEHLETYGNIVKMYQLNNNGSVAEFNGANATDSFNFKAKITGWTGDNGGINNVEIMVPIKYLSNFWRILEMPLINVKLI